MIVGVLLLGTVVWLGLDLRNARSKPAVDPGMLLLQQQMQGFQDRLDRFNESVNSNLKQGNQALSERLDNAAKVVGEVQNRLGKLAQTNEQILGISKNIASLEDMLRAPKFRGGMGELFLGDLLAQILPPEHYTLQHRFKSGDTVDAAIRLGEKLVPVDSKFPLENFKRIVTAENDSERVAATKQFFRDVKKHVDAIATKYIRTDEGTYEFALMYIPAENIYYETIIKDDSSAAENHPNLTYCMEKRVIPVSPNSFYAYLKTILLGLRGLTIEARANQILGELSQLNIEFSKFGDSFRLIGTHLENAKKNYELADKALDKYGDRLQRIETEQNPPLPGSSS